VENDDVVIATELLVLSEEPKLATLTLHTMAGSAAFDINAGVAEHLIDMLERFVGKRSP